MAYKPLYDKQYFKNLMAQIEAARRKGSPVRSREEREPQPKAMSFPNAAAAAAYLLEKRKTKKQKGDEKKA